jgi:hypothetical protein
VGGNKILLSNKDTTILLEFGKGFSRRAKYFEEDLSPRTAKKISENPSRYLCSFGIYAFTALIDMKPPPARCTFTQQASPIMKSRY